MTKSFSLHSKSIPYFIGLSLSRWNRLIIVSPWISNISIEFPILKENVDNELPLIEALNEFNDCQRTIITGSDPFNDYVLDRVDDSVEILIIDDLHAKAVITDELLYNGSANITRGGVAGNVELATISENDYGDADTFVTEQLGISLE